MTRGVTGAAPLESSSIGRAHPVGAAVEMPAPSRSGMMLPASRNGRALVLVFVLILPVAARASSSLAVPPSSCMCAGSQDAVPITLSPADGVTNLTLALQYDAAKFLPTRVILGPLTSGPCALSWSTPTMGRINVGLACSSPLSGAGTVAVMYFRGIGTAPASAPLTWLQHDLNGGQIASVAQNGSLCLTSSNHALVMSEDVSGTPGSSVSVPLAGTVSAGSIGINAAIQWDPAVLNGVAVVLDPGLPPDWAVDYNLSAGTAGISLFGTTPISGSRTFASIAFDVVAGIGAVSSLDLTAGDVNEVPACLNDGTFYVCPVCDDGDACTTDSCATGQCVSVPSPRPAVIGGSVRVDKTPQNATVSWTDPTGPYNVYRGTRTANAAFAYNHGCLQPGVAASSITDSDVPLAGQLFYYLVSRVGSCGESSLGSDSAGVERPNATPCALAMDEPLYSADQWGPVPRPQFSLAP